MKFKTKEELIEELVKKQYISDKRPIIDSDLYNGGVQVGLDKAFKSFAERVEFYKEYIGNPHWFKIHFPKEWDFIPDKAIYDHWLFEYCFGDVIE